MNEPAFPQAYDRYGKNLPGMDLLDWFAAQALVSVLQDRSLTDGYCDRGPRIFAECAYDIADAMMAERMRRAGE
jgi:hypothetical protein